MPAFFNSLMQIDEIQYLINSINHIQKRLIFLSKKKFEKNKLIQKIKLSYSDHLKFLKRELWQTEKSKFLKQKKS
jgi:hypothetical protein